MKNNKRLIRITNYYLFCDTISLDGGGFWGLCYYNSSQSSSYYGLAAMMAATTTNRLITMGKSDRKVAIGSAMNLSVNILQIVIVPISTLRFYWFSHHTFFPNTHKYDKQTTRSINNIALSLIISHIYKTIRTPYCA